MKARIFSLALFAIAILILLHRDRATHEQTIHYPTQPIHLYNPQLQTGYTIGRWESRPQIPISFSQSLSYKKITNYVFTHYNVYRVELIFTDLGYASNLDIKVFAEEINIHVSEPLGFSLYADRIDGMNFYVEKTNLELIVRQFLNQELDETVTMFNLTLTNGKTKIVANLIHYTRNEECINIVRPKHIITHKCYGGYGEGKMNTETSNAKDNRRRLNNFNLNKNMTRSALDVLQGPGTHWKFVRIMGTGFNKSQFYERHHLIDKESWVGFNFGHMNGHGEDFLFLSGKIIPVKGLNYTIDEKMFYRDSQITFTAKQPVMELKFKIVSTNRDLKDMGVIKLDILRAQGFWTGDIEIEGETRSITQLISGVIEISDSLF